MNPEQMNGIVSDQPRKKPYGAIEENPNKKVTQPYGVIQENPNIDKKRRKEEKKARYKGKSLRC